MSSYTWQTTFRALFDRCVKQYQSGKTDPAAWFSTADRDFLKSIGCREREFFDFVEDHANAGGGEPSVETALLIAAARRDYLNAVQHGKTSDKTIPPSDLPAKSAEMDGIPWLPRIIVKARAKLRGEMDPDTMFGCGGDRAFCERHDIHPADLLRAVWAAGDDDRRILAFVKGGGKWA
ncbi:MAG: DUF5069 domain-containing protein [Verrucomicrobiaceae bacterium]|nr:DUF5069 domain-containing protein [Verrucomicrobiaceae bacterium]